MAMEVVATSPLVQGAVVVVVTVLVVQAVRWVMWYRGFFSFFNALPGETSFRWIWGNLHMVKGMEAEDRLRYGYQLMLKYPKFYRFWLGPFRPTVSLFHPDNVRELLKHSEPKPGMYRFGEPWLGLGLLLANGDRWARSRRLLTPAFHFDILKPYVAISNAAVEKFIERISDHVKEGGNFEAFSLVSLCTLDVILQCAMSYKDDIQNKGETHPYVQAVKELSELWFERGRNPLLYNDFVYSLTSSGRRFKQHCAFVHSLSETIIRTRRKILAKEGISKKRNLDFLDILLTAKDETGQGLTSLEIRNEVDTFLFEGHDTTASAISWILFSLAGHPQCQTRAQAEVDEILEGRDRPDLEWGDLSKLEYLTQVIKEGMRLHCPVPFIQRQLTKPVTIEGVMLPVGTFCTIHLQNLHHNPVVWKDPWTFDPDRFHPDNLKDKDTYAFVPFSAGPRNCIGQHFAMNEEKVVLGRLLHKFTFTLDPSHVVKKKASVVMRAENGIKLFATPRR
ncbi:cytochrome P450 4F2-like isoform X3 [Babylonia areolata]|uniref:cytochrome P450 4F2-like isoform X3 n=3 Tax=Babylonia areolata TaxID=304850 RepID=UPI003FD602A1